MSLILQEPWSEGLSMLFRLDEVLVRRQTPHQELIIARSETYGLALFLDALIQSTEADEYIYHEAFVHPAAVLHGRPRRALVAGAGEGATMRELLRHDSVEHVTAVDLDPDVVAACREFLPTWSQGSFEDPRVELRFEDVRDTLARAPENPYDLILLDITDPVQDGPAVELFTTKFFRQVAAALHADGILVLQSGELDPIDLRPSQCVKSTLEAVFPWVRMTHLHVPCFHGIWSITLAAHRSFDVDPPDLAARIARLPEDALKVYTPTMHRALFELPPFLRRGLAQPGRIITGDDEDRLITVRPERDA